MEEDGEAGGPSVPARDPRLGLGRVPEEGAPYVLLGGARLVGQALVDGELADEIGDERRVRRLGRGDRYSQIVTPAFTTDRSLVTLCFASPKSMSVLSR